MKAHNKMPDFITLDEFNTSGPDSVILLEFWEDSVEPNIEIRMRPWIIIPIEGSSCGTFFTASNSSPLAAANKDNATDHSPEP